MSWMPTIRKRPAGHRVSLQQAGPRRRAENLAGAVESRLIDAYNERSLATTQGETPVAYGPSILVAIAMRQ